MSGFDISSVQELTPPAVQAAMKQRAAQIFDMSAAQQEAPAHEASLTSIKEMPNRRKIPKAAIVAGVVVLAGAAYYLSKKKGK